MNIGSIHPRAAVPKDTKRPAITRIGPACMGIGIAATILYIVLTLFSLTR